MLLKPFNSLPKKHIVVLTDGITPDELFYHTPQPRSYYYINTAVVNFRSNSYSDIRSCTLAYLNESQAPPIDTDIIFELAGRKMHLDFDVFLPKDVFVRITLGRNRNGNSYHPFTIQFEYI